MIRITMFFLLAVATCGVFVNSESLNLPKNCPSEAVAMAGEFLAHDCKYVSTLSCFQDFIDCYEKEGYHLKKPIAACAKELNMPELNDLSQFISQACDTEGLGYFKTLQVYCCIKSKDKQMNNIPWKKVRDISQICFDKVNCPKK